MSNVTPWLLFQSAVDANGVGWPWNAPEQALIPDFFGEATSGPIGTVFAAQQTTLLRLTQPDLGSALPQGFVLLGVEAEVRGRWSGASTGSRTVPVEAVIGATVRKSLGSCLLPLNTRVACVKGGPTDTMNLSEQDVLDPNFGFQLHGTSTTGSLSGNTLRIDSVSTRIYYDNPPSPVRGRGRSRATVVAGIGL